MSPRDLRIAGIITAVCFALSFAASYSYVHGWYWTAGVLPLALTVVLVLIATIILEFVGGPRKAAVKLLHGEAKLTTEQKRGEGLFALLFRRYEKPLSPLLWLVLFTIGQLASILRKARRERSDEMLRLLGRAHG
jgi:hypothetical protein